MTETPAEPILNIRGEKVGLGPLDPSMLPRFTRWINDFTTLRTLGMEPRPMTREEEDRWYQHATSSSDVIFFAIYDLADPQGSLFIHSGGQSGNLLSPHYRAFAEPWARGEYVRMVTDRERDYLWQFYASERQARINPDMHMSEELKNTGRGNMLVYKGTTQPAAGPCERRDVSTFARSTSARSGSRCAHA